MAGHNYGQGSSREHAALASQHLGVRAVVAGTYARIHRSNLIAVGIVPFELGDPNDWSRVEIGHHWRIDGVRDAVDHETTTLSAQTDTGAVVLRLTLSAVERAVLLAGGLLAHVRDGGRPRVQQRDDR